MERYLCDSSQHIVWFGGELYIDWDPDTRKSEIAMVPSLTRLPAALYLLLIDKIQEALNITAYW